MLHMWKAPSTFNCLSQEEKVKQGYALDAIELRETPSSAQPKLSMPSLSDE